LIQQQVIPAKPGNSGFRDSIAAFKVAKLVISKLKTGNFPPSLKALEIDSILETP